MSDTRQFPNLPQSTWTCWDANLVQVLEGHGCDSVKFSGGNSGTVSFHHPVPLSNGQFALTYSYDPSTSTLTVTITDKPNVVSESGVFGFVQKLVYDCPG